MGPHYFESGIMVDVRDRIKGCLYGALIADALAMPTHWFYGGTQQVKKIYGGLIQGYIAPSTHLANSIMSKSNTGGGGRGSFKGDVIGNIIFHNKKQYWKPNADYHYHQGMSAGDNTLEALLLRRVLVQISKYNGEFNSKEILNDYVSFMTTPNTHNDTYCGTCHRMFFAKYASGIELSSCPDNDGHNVDTCDSIVTTIPIAILSKSDELAKENIETMISLTRNSPLSVQYAQHFGQTLRNIIFENTPFENEIIKLSSKFKYNVKKDVETKLSNPVTACYLSSSFPAVLFMTFKYSNSFESGLLANANRGGENVATGTLIGALLGAKFGYSNIPQHLIDGLAQSEVIAKEIDSFISKILPE